jgi:hypothetical protein
MARRRARIAAAVAAPLCLCAAGLFQTTWSQMDRLSTDFPSRAEFHFVRMEYVDFNGSRGGGGFGRRFGGGGGFGRGWWMQDWPEADVHFSQGIHRLTRIELGEPVHMPVTSKEMFNYPWLYATQTGYWDLSEDETHAMREYLLRGGFLVTDDFWGLDEWQVFQQTMERVLPGEAIVEIENTHPMMNVMYTITERVTIPGLRHLRRGPGGRTVVEQQGGPPHWRALHDPQNRMVVAINYNMDVGDAWEHADWPQYPEEMTALSYRFGINYIIYAMTH